MVPLERRRWDELDATTVPVISHPHFTGTGTRTLRDNAKREIDALFRRSFPLDVADG